MSVLRLLSPGPRPQASSSSTKLPSVPTLALHVPNYGAILMNPPAERLPEGDRRFEDEGVEAPRNDQMLNGELEISIPYSMGPRRCKAIRVGLRTVIKLDIGPGRMGEEDVVFERKVEIIGATADGISLEAGSQRFDFTIIIPSTLAPHDWHTNGTITHDLYAELEGLPEPSGWIPHTSSSTSLFSFRHHHSKSGHRSPSAGVSRSSSPAPQTARRSASVLPSASGATTPTTGGLNPALLSAAQSLSITRQEAPVLPRAPTYDESELNAHTPEGLSSHSSSTRSVPTTGHNGGNQNGEWLVGTFKQKRSIMLIYNPNPAGTITQLDERASGIAPGLGPWSFSTVSDVWTICALVQSKLYLNSISPDVTVFHVRLLLSQTHSIISPRDEAEDTKPIVSTRNFTVFEVGKRPPANHLHPDKHIPALWRGPGAGGRDTEELKIEQKGRLPTDDVARPSTIPGIITPITVSHHLILEVYFSVFGEDNRGEPMRLPGPGGLRMLRVSRPTVVPSCAMVPQVFDLPTYESHTQGRESVSPSRCKLCGSLPNERQCTSCPHAVYPHARHDHPADLVGSSSGICPECSNSIMPSGGPGWSLCACGMKLEEMEERMRRATVGEQFVDAVATPEPSSDKIWAERGRRGRSD